MSKSKRQIETFKLHGGHGKKGDFVSVIPDDEPSVSKLDPDVELLWHNIGRKSEQSWILSTDCDKFGNIYVIGKFVGTVTLGHTTLNVSGTSPNSIGIFISKLSPLGKFEWSERIGILTNNDHNNVDLLLKVSPDQNIFVVGGFYGELTLDHNIFDIGVNPRIEHDDNIFIIKISHTGIITYVNTAKGVANDHIDFGIDHQENVYITGTFTNNASFGNITINTQIDNLNGMYICKLNQNGIWEWVQNTLGTGQCSSYSIAVDPEGNSYVTGVFEGTVSFDTKNMVVGAGKLLNMFVCKYNTSGHLIWINRSKFDPVWFSKLSPNADVVNMMIGESISIDKDNNSYITGIINGLVNLDDLMVDISPQSIFVVKVNNVGKFQWIKYVELTLPVDEKHGVHCRIVTEQTGHSYLYGYFSYNITFDQLTLSSDDGVSTFLAEIDTNGKWSWAQFICGIIENDVHPISTDSNGNVIIGGGFRDVITINEFKILGNHRLNLFVLKFGRKLPSTLGIITEGDYSNVSVTFHGTVKDIPNLSSGKNYYLTPRGELTTHTHNNKFIGTSLSSSSLFLNP